MSRKSQVCFLCLCNPIFCPDLWTCDARECPSVGGAPGPGAPAVTRLGPIVCSWHRGLSCCRTFGESAGTRWWQGSHWLQWDYNPQYLQVLFLALLLSSCYGQEYPAKVDICIFSKIRYYDDDVRDWSNQSDSLILYKVVCQNLSWDYSIAILVDDAWIMYQVNSIREEECVFWWMDTREKYGGNIFEIRCREKPSAWNEVVNSCHEYCDLNICVWILTTCKLRLN